MNFKRIGILFLLLLLFNSCENTEETGMGNQTKIIFLHHSTGGIIWEGGLSRIARKLGFDGDVPKWFTNYNKKNKKNYLINDSIFPNKMGNDLYDYYNIWVKNGGKTAYKEESTLEILTSGITLNF